MFQTNSDFLINRLEDIPTQETLHSFLISQENSAPHARNVLENPLSTTFLLASIIGDMCDILNKHCSPIKLSKKLIFYTSDLTTLLYFEKKKNK